MKFLCDEMLQRLGNWLRVAGYDTLIESSGRDDYDLLRQAIDENRYLLTRDRKIMEYRRAPGTVILLNCDGLEPCIEVLSKQLPVNWQFKPFSRCTVCNTPLQRATSQQAQQLPAKTQAHVDRAYYCPVCDQVYWDGSHVKRMRSQIKNWREKFSA